jgi:predicted site-specific integrase-resolvase
MSTKSKMTDAQLIEYIIDTITDIQTDEYGEWSDLAEDISSVLQSNRKDLYKEFLKKHENSKKLVEIRNLENQIELLENQVEKTKTNIKDLTQRLNTFNSK